MKQLIIDLFNGINTPIIFRGSIAYKLYIKEEINNLTDIDIIVNNLCDFNKVELFLKKNHNIKISEGKFIYHNPKLNRKRLIINFKNKKIKITLDILICNNYFTNINTLLFQIANLYLPTPEDIIADLVVASSNTQIGIIFNNRIEKALNIIKRIHNLQYLINYKNLLPSLKRILKIQNYYYSKEYTLYDILTNFHIFARKLQKNHIEENCKKLDINYFIIHISQQLFPVKKNIIEFYDSKKEYGSFSNFSNHKVFFNGIKYQTSEHCYQSQKTFNCQIQNKIMKQSTPKEAAKVGRNIDKKYLRENWDFIKTSIMYNIVKEKIMQNSDIYLLLISTYNKKIIEKSKNDLFWGIGYNNKGKNTLGKILENIRSEILWM